MSEYPNLAGVATADLVEQITGGGFAAKYINWSRTINLLRLHAPGWLPELVMAVDGGIVHSAPVGAFLLIRFRHQDGQCTPEVPQAIMDHKNNSVPLANVTARDITDTHRRGVCMAAAFTFGLAYELWAKMPLESGFAEPEESTVWEKANQKKKYMNGLITCIGKEDAAGVRELWDEMTTAQQEDVWLSMKDFSTQRAEIKRMLEATKPKKEESEE